MALGATVYTAIVVMDQRETQGRRLEVTVADKGHVEVVFEDMPDHAFLVGLDAANSNLATCRAGVKNHDASDLRDAAKSADMTIETLTTCMASTDGDCMDYPVATLGTETMDDVIFETDRTYCCFCAAVHDKLCPIVDGKEKCSAEVDVLKEDYMVYLPLYCLGVLYMFVALAIVCDEFFVPSLEMFVDEWEVSMDVAGATFMAAGGSAPELFTSFIGTFKESDVGFGTIVGSAVFNVLFVIGVCAVASKEVLTLTWWPLARDCTYYTLSLSMLAFFFKGNSSERIQWWEALILFGMYIGYVVLMRHSNQLQAWVNMKLGTEVEKIEKTETEVQVDAKFNIAFTQHSQFRAGILTLLTQAGAVTDTMGVHVVSKVVGDVRASFDELDRDKSGYLEKNELVELLKRMGCSASNKNVDEVMEKLDSDGDGKISFDEFSNWYVVSEQRVEAEMGRAFKALDEDNSGFIEAKELKTLFGRLGIVIDSEEEIKQIISELDKTGSGSISQEDFENWYRGSLFWGTKQQEYQKEQEAADPIDPFDWPDNLRGQVWYIITIPLVMLLWLTLPDVRQPKRQGVKFAVAGFLGSIFWIGMFSFCMVEWATIVSNSIRVPIAVAGLTVLAAGTSVPDLLSSVIVAKQGEGDMAVSSSIGSNIFDVLVGLPLPWLCFTLSRGKDVEVRAESLGLSIIVLVFMLVAVITTVKACNWRMTRMMGYSMFVLYVVFVVQDLLRQLPRGNPTVNMNF